jgi:hypothetical protein
VEILSRNEDVVNRQGSEKTSNHEGAPGMWNGKEKKVGNGLDKKSQFENTFHIAS